MASTTQYLGLKLLGTSDSDHAKYFEEWRQDINGEGEEQNLSNMQKIDAAYHNLEEDLQDYISTETIDEMIAGTWTPADN